MNTFTFTGKAKLNLLIVMIVGFALIGLGAITRGGGHDAHGDEHAVETHGQEEQLAHVAPTLTEETETATDAVVDEVAHMADSLHDETHAAEVPHEEHADEAHAADAHGEDHGGGHHAAAAPSSTKKVVMTNFWALIMLLFWMGMAALFLLAALTVGWAGWHIMIQKIFMSIMTVIPVMMILGVIVFIIGREDIFIWTIKEKIEADALMMTKQAFLNLKTFAILSAVWCGIILTLLTLWWKKLHNQDVDPDLKHFRSARTLAAISIVFVAVINAFGCWHWMMSIEPNWYSTLYAWYTMASAAGVMFAVTILTMIYLKSNGYLPYVNDSHYHDVAKFMFAVSVFWTYLWFSQYMLIWYGNIPEETMYFAARIKNYPVLFYGAFVINFILPFFVLLKRDAKRNKGVLMFACVMIIIGHWFDFFNMIVVPNVPQGGMGLISLGSLILFLGIAGFVILSALSRFKSLDSREHPYYHESLKHHI
jgi:hypothetical protein